MANPPTWALAVSEAVRYFQLRPWQPRLALEPKAESLPQRVARLRAAWENSRLSDGARAADFNTSILEAAFHRAGRKRVPVDAVLGALQVLGVELMLQNDNVFDFPAIDLTRSMTAVEVGHVTEKLIEVQTRIEHDERIHDLFAEGLCQLFTALIKDLPESAYAAEAAPFSVPLFALVDPPTFVARFLGVFLNDLVPDTPDAIAALPFLHTRHRLWQNLLEVSHMTPEQLETAPHRIVVPKDCDLAPSEMVAAYLGGTPLAAFAETPLPFAIPQERRFEHCHILGGTGHGKTQLLQTLMLADFDDPGRPAVVAIDSQGDMVRTLSLLARFDPALDDRLVILDPADTSWPLRLNMFDINRARIDAMSLGAREQILAGIVELYDYIFGSLLGAELTQKQSVVFRYIARLMLEIPDATIQTLLQLMEEKQFSSFAPYIAKLRGTTRAFFENEFADRSFSPTKQQIRRRLYGVLSNPAFERMFSHPKNAFDMKAAFDTGKVVLINTAKDVLKAEASTIFGRYMIALAMQAALERAADPETKRRPAFLYIDEAADYFDQNIDTLLIQARKYKVGITLAHQHLDQLTPSLRASVMTNPAARFAGGVSEKDAHAIDADMRTTSQFLMSMRKGAGDTEFACFIRNCTPTALGLRVPLGRAEREPRMGAAAYAALKDRIRRQVAAPIGETDAHIAAAMAGAAMVHQEATSYESEY
jgi:hypothetical protein